MSDILEALEGTLSALRALKSQLDKNGDFSVCRKGDKPLTFGDAHLLGVIFQQADDAIEKAQAALDAARREED